MEENKKCLTCNTHKGLSLYWGDCKECWDKSTAQMEKERDVFFQSKGYKARFPLDNFDDGGYIND